MSATHFSGPLFVGGVPVPYGAAGLAPNLISGEMGKAFFVDNNNGSDSNDGLTLTYPLKTLSKAQTLMVANRNDVAYVVGNSSASTGAVRESDTLEWTKSMCHIVGLNSFNRIAHRVSIRAASGSTAFTPMVQVTGDGCVFANFHVFDGNETAGAICWEDQGERNSYYNVHFGGMGESGTAAASATSRSLLLNGGGERFFKDCTIGLDTVSRSAANAELELKSQATRDIFEDCLFLAQAGDAGHLFVKANASSAAVDRFVMFKRCIFHNGVNSTATGTTATVGADASLSGTVLLYYCTTLNNTTAAWGTTGPVYIDGAAPTAATSGEAVQTA